MLPKPTGQFQASDNITVWLSDTGTALHLVGEKNLSFLCFVQSCLVQSFLLLWRFSSYPSMSRPGLPCPIMFCCALACSGPSGLVLSCPVLSLFSRVLSLPLSDCFLSCHVLSYHSLACPVLTSSHVVSLLVLSCPPLFVPVLSKVFYPVLFCPFLSSPVLSRPITFCRLSFPSCPFPFAGLACAVLSCLVLAWTVMS